MVSPPRGESKQTLERQLVQKLRDVMLHVDLEEVTSKQLRLQLEEEMKMDLKDYRGYLDQQMLRILGQMERPSRILDYLYLVGVGTLASSSSVFSFIIHLQIHFVNGKAL